MQRVDDHRKNFDKFCISDNSDSSPSEFRSSLAAHLFDYHEVKNNLHFDVSFKFEILYTASPKSSEQYFIEKLKTMPRTD